MMSSNVLRISFIAFTCLVSPSFGGWETTTGGESGLWEAHSLIIARVKSTRVLDRDPGSAETATHVLSLEPLLTVAGHFDPSAQSEIKVRLAAARIGSSVHEVPVAGSTVLAVIYPGNIDGDEARPFIWVTPDRCTFMPDDAALIRLENMSDKRIFETLEKVRAARAAATKPRPKA